jgi:hypothetical protein
VNGSLRKRVDTLDDGVSSCPRQCVCTRPAAPRFFIGRPERGVGKSSHHPDAKVAISHRSPVPRRFPVELGCCLPECHEMAGISPASCDPPIVGKDHFQPPAQLLLFRPLVSLSSISLSGTYPMSEQPIVMASRNVADSMSTGHASLYRGERRDRMNKQPIERETVTV